VAKNKGRLPGTCIFCGLGRLSKEHLWSEWMHGLVRAHGVPQHNVAEHYVGDKKRGVISATKKVRGGHVTTRKFRVVCRVCNNTWMSGLEEAAKPILSPLLVGGDAVLSPDMQETLAKWVVLKAMVAEQSKPQEAVFSDLDRKVFKDEGIVPQGVTIWLARCFSPLWRNAFLRSSAQLALSDSLPPRVIPTEEKKNVQTTALGAGELFVYTIVSKAEGLDLSYLAKVADYMLRLWPGSGDDIAAPFGHIVAEETASGIARTLHRLVNSEHVHHLDIPGLTDIAR